MHRFEFTLVTNRKTQQIATSGKTDSLAEMYVFDKTCNLCFLLSISVDIRNHTHAVKVKYGHVCREQQLLVSNEQVEQCFQECYTKFTQ